MRYHYGYSLVTYTSDDGKTSKQVWNSRDGALPEVITLDNGKPAGITRVEFKGPGYKPAAGITVVSDVPPDPPAPVPGASATEMGWPGQPHFH